MSTTGQMAQKPVAGRRGPEMALPHKRHRSIHLVLCDPGLKRGKREQLGNNASLILYPLLLSLPSSQMNGTLAIYTQTEMWISKAS